MSDYERLGMKQEIADLRFALRQALDQRDLLEVKVSQYQASRTLADAEREAVDVARTVLCCTHDERLAKHAANLRGLLERMA